MNCAYGVHSSTVGVTLYRPTFKVQYGVHPYIMKQCKDYSEQQDTNAPTSSLITHSHARQEKQKIVMKRYKYP
jgi:hypothetical protein